MHLGKRSVGGDGHDLTLDLPPVVALGKAAARHAHLPSEEATVPQRLASERAAECQVRGVGHHAAAHLVDHGGSWWIMVDHVGHHAAAHLL